MLKIIITNDPFFNLRSRGGNSAVHGEKNGAPLFSRVLAMISQSEKCVIPYAEYLFDTDEKALVFLEAVLASHGETILLCRDLNLVPDILLRYAQVTHDPVKYADFFPDIEKLPFSPTVREEIRENLTGLPFSQVETLLTQLPLLPEKEALAFLLEAKRNLLRHNNILEVVHIDTSINSIGGLTELKKWIVARKDNFSKEARNFGIPMPKGILLLGVQGCGKSLTAKTIANIWNFPLVRLDFVNLFRQGKSVEELLKEAISVIEGFAPVVLWIDEIEKALSQENQSSEIRRILGWLMTWMQEKTSSVFLVATANQVDILPPELLRKGRFDEIFFVDLPVREEREEIFRIHITQRGRKSEEYNLQKLAEASENFSGAEIEQIVVDALISDYGKGRDLSQKSMEESLRHTVPLSVTYDEVIKKLRIWSKNRARNASGNARIESYFQSR